MHHIYLATLHIILFGFSESFNFTSKFQWHRKQLLLLHFPWSCSIRVLLFPNHQDQRGPLLNTLKIYGLEGKLELTTIVRPITDRAPVRLTELSEILIFAIPEASASTLPKSPTWRISSSGAPCSLPWGLKWAPNSS